jgi:signal transduction histidine kinase
MHEKDDPAVFPSLTDEQIECLSEHGAEKVLEDGEYLFREDDRVDSFYVVLDGAIRISRVEGGAEAEIVTHPPGAFTGQLAILAGKKAAHRARAVGETRLLEITSDAFREVAAANPEVADIFISTIARRMRQTQAWMRQTEKLAALGKLSAGLAHELNNPAAAARRAADSLREAILRAQENALRNDRRFSPDQREALAALQREAASKGDAVIDTLERSDREDELAIWLEDRGVEEAWNLAPALIGAGLEAERLEDLAGGMEGELLAGALGWLGTTIELSGLAGEVEKSTGRISELVKAMKEYSFMDRTPAREVDLHEGLENTLAILGHKLKKGVEVFRNYDQDLPRIQAHGGELNQVWTNLIDNAVDAMHGKGRLEITTGRDGDGCVIVEISDSGDGIPKEVRNRVFEPFFTTKGVGEGTGLGLDIARRIVKQRHGGDIRVDSEPGRTRFRVRLPIEVKTQNGG